MFFIKTIKLKLDFSKKIIHVNHTLQYTADRGHFLEELKTKSSKRHIPMINNVCEILKEQQKIYLSAPIVSIQKKEFVFCLPNGEPITRDRVTIELNKIIQNMERNGTPVGHITCHCLRHTFATRAIEAGMKPQTLKTILGHSNLSMTMDLYSHVLPDTKAAEMEKLASMF
ncbi:MAG: site-specific integrase [Lachnospiraceae bacterium]|nr:site-specific integrase [Lachnospiraceae bacterium]